MSDITLPFDLSTRLRGVNIYLVGMMGSGKTTIAQVLASKLGYRFMDTDALVEQVAGCSVAELFATQGEAAFRQLETQVLGELSAFSRLAIATGGGIVLDRLNWSYLHHGLVVWLDVPVEHLYQRLQHDTQRPLLQNPDPKQQLQNLLEQRRSLYAQADVRVLLQGDEPPAQVGDRVLESILAELKPQAYHSADVN
ncbi:MAG: shikimate kinase [Kaiparowitsia implicata GSE-PSE-MK54-09C]|jgi:shikimate kinase|nr:shikimate kinase [Kaiparowitsia implicata GSE-PSE-MK54-09C]